MSETTGEGINGGAPETTGSGGTGGGGGIAIPQSQAKVSKLMLWPSRKFNLGNYETIDLNAGIEITFETPTDINSPEMVKACEDARKFIKAEFNKQWIAFKPVVRKVEVKK